jgi:F-type H+-transporting ATPase subunit a
MELLYFNTLLNSPLEQFEVTSILGLQIPMFGYITITITNLALYSIIVLILIIGMHYLGNNENKLIPSK